MATSGSTNYTQTRDDIINDSFSLLGYIGDDLQNEDVNFARRMLNDLVKEWQAQGLHQWARTEGVLFLTLYTSKYGLDGTSSGAKFALANDVVDTTLGAAEASGQTVITVTSSTGMAASDVVGIVLDDATTHWTTIVSVDDATTITITVATTGAAASGNNVYTFTNYVAVPRRVINCRVIASGLDTNSTGDSLNEIRMEGQSHKDYFDLNTKVTNDIPTFWYYDRQRAQGDFYVWPRPNTTNYRINVTYERFLEDFDSLSDNPDFPVEWLSCLKYNLAVRLAPAFGKGIKIREDGLDVQAGRLLAQMLAFDTEVQGIQFIPNKDGY